MSDHALHLAEADLESAKKDYDELLAEFEYLVEMITVNRRRRESASERLADCNTALEALRAEKK